MVTNRAQNSDNSYNNNNIREYSIVHGAEIQVGKHDYLVCIPTMPDNVTNISVARAVERRIKATRETGEIKYVKNVILIDGFDEDLKNLENGGTPHYKLAIVNIEMPPNECGEYTYFENEFYESLCRGDAVIGDWANVFLLANPNFYLSIFSASSSAAQTQTATQTPAAVKGAFQKWKGVTEKSSVIELYEKKIRELEYGICNAQNDANELAESLRFLSRQNTGLGVKSDSNLEMCLSILKQNYSRVCVSDAEFFEINKNMKLRTMLDLVVKLVSGCDECQELIHVLDSTGEQQHVDLFLQIERYICRIHHLVRKFDVLHLKAERSIFAIKNRKIFNDFGLFLNTAVEIVEEIASRNSTHTQDVEYFKQYGQSGSRNIYDAVPVPASTTASASTASTDANAFVGGNSGSCWGDYGWNWNYDNTDNDSDASFNGFNSGFKFNNSVNKYEYDYSEPADNVDNMTLADATDAINQLLNFEQRLVTTTTEEKETEKTVTITTTTTEATTTEVEAVVVVEQQQEQQEQQEAFEKVESSDSQDSQNKNGNKKGGWFSWF